MDAKPALQLFFTVHRISNKISGGVTLALSLVAQQNRLTAIFAPCSMHDGTEMYLIVFLFLHKFLNFLLPSLKP